MFRRLPHTLPKDPAFPTDLNLLGYFINEHDQIRQIKSPDQKYQFGVNRNDRFNDVYKETMNACIRHIVKQRMDDLGFQTLRLPLGAAETDNHVPVWVSAGISTKKRVIVIFGERNQDLGVFSYRVIGDEGIDIGSCLNLVKAIQHGPTGTTDDAVPGIIIANPAQLHWYRGGGRAITSTEWQNLPRKSAVHEPFSVHPVKNRIPQNKDFREHIHYIFEDVIPTVVNKDARLDLIGLEYPGSAAVEYLAMNWPKWSSRVSGICLGTPQHKIVDLKDTYKAPDAFIDFLSRRSRAYFVSPKPIESVMEGRDEFGCNCFASGEELYQENIIVRSWGSMLDWFTLVHTVTDYAEPELSVVEGGNREGEQENGTDVVAQLASLATA